MNVSGWTQSVLNEATKEVNWLREEQNLHAGYVGHICIIAATRDEPHDEGFYEASVANKNRHVSPINSDGMDGHQWEKTSLLGS